MDYCFLLGQLENADSFGELAPPLQIAIFLGAMSFATAALVSLTAFTRIIIVLSFVRRALSTQEIPPNQVIMGLSFFLTLFVMAPTFEKDQRKCGSALSPGSKDGGRKREISNLFVVGESIQRNQRVHAGPYASQRSAAVRRLV